MLFILTTSPLHYMWRIVFRFYYISVDQIIQTNDFDYPVTLMVFELVLMNISSTFFLGPSWY